ncbi:hypothetical protein [Actibacterium sp. 188UL27-1]|uniref:hypothetical protein n=1 Tax=Actibacterium sp. 188UL27-1 TaxID=2786961 RepID=UPI00195647CA|nr:hypothetical protein [Actibacterium sp. 188UL27-1]MBM7069242.1 hypothetical protein [Actibacterium sp. 188UL27-1]
MTDDRSAKDRGLDDGALEVFFDAARRTGPAPSDDLLRRVMADAAQSAQPAVSARPALPWWRSAWASLGGWPSMAGLCTATIAGILIGYSPPAALDVLLADLQGEQVASFLVDDAFLTVFETDLMTDD